MEQAFRNDQCAAHDVRQLGGDQALLGDLCQTFLQPCLQGICTSARIFGIQLGVGLASHFLFPQVIGAIIPILDLCGQAFLDSFFRLVEHLLSVRPYFLEMLRHDLCDGVFHGALFHALHQPILLRYVWSDHGLLRICSGAIVQIRRVACVDRMPSLVQFYKMDVL